MPFGLKLKKTRRYYVSGKNSYVARIQLLDSTILECTLSPENSGSDCLAMVAQKLQLEENEYFGLQYINKNYKLRWVDLDKPLKKQLDKNANDPMLRFGVMLYASNVNSLQQEMTRYLYFLQLRSDIIEGILPCSPEQAVLLASYAVQAEFGDHAPYTHTVEFLKDFVILPKNLTSEADSLTELTQEVANQHRNHQGMPPDVAEQAYITEASQLDGYGQESYPAKDESGNDLLLGASFLGISVKHLNGQPTVYFKWNDIKQPVHNKRLFGIETVRSQDTIQFQMEDAETAKYVCRMFLTKHKFYKHSMDAMQGRKEASLDGGRLITKSSFPIPLQRKPTLTRRSAEKAQDEILAFTHARTNSLQNRITVQPEEGQFTQSQLSLDGPTIEHAYSNGGLAVVDGSGSVYSAPSTNSLNQGHFMHASPASSNPSIASSEPPRHTPTSALPQYRPSPDYNEALVRAHNRLNTIGDQSQSLSNLGRAHAYQQPETMVYSQPEIRQANQYNNLNPYGTHLNLNLASPAYSYVDASSESLPYGPVSLRNHAGMTHTYSTPELTAQHLPAAHEYITSKLLLDHYNPPPAYPRNSTSTPDLPRQSLQYQHISSSSPDLMSRRLLGPIPTLQEPASMHGAGASLAINVNSASGSRSTSQRSLPLSAIQALNLNNEEYMETLSQVASSTEHTIHISRDVQTDITHEDIIDDDTVEEGPLVITAAASSPTEMRENSPKVPIYNIENSNSTAFMGMTPDLASNSETASVSSVDAAAVALSAAQAVPQHVEADVKIVQDKPAMSIEYDPKTPGYVQIIAAAGDSVRDSDGALDRRKLNHSESSISMEKTVALEALDRPPPGGGGAEAADRVGKAQLQQRASNESVATPGTSGYSTSNDSDAEEPLRLSKGEKLKGVHMGPLKLAAMNGLTLSRLIELKNMDKEDSPALKDPRWKVLEQKLADGLVFTEYEQIPKKKPKAVYSTAQRTENAAKNRFTDVLPYEDTRVKLVQDKRNPTGYINASLVTVTVAGEELHYIAAQGPLHETVIDWWNMIWEQGVHVIVMLTAEQENGKQKCFRYWPQFNSSKNTLDIGPFKLTGQFCNDSGFYVTSGITLRNKTTGEQRTVWHLQFTDWPHQGCPDDVHGFLAFLEEIQSVCRHANSMIDSDVSPPVLVHCSAGVGRTGVVILADIMIACLEYNENVDVPKMLSHLRKQRMLMVQTVGQYIFVYRTLIQFLKNSRLI